MAPYNFLELAFPGPAEAGEERPLVPAEELRTVREKVAGMRTRMTLARLSDEQRGQLGVPLSQAQLGQAQACLRFLRLREDIARAARVPVGLLQETVDKDLVLAQSEDAVAPLAEAVRRGLSQVGAAITACTDRIDWYVDEQIQDRGAPLEQRDRLAALFGTGSRVRKSAESAALQRKRLEARLSRRRARGLGQAEDESAAVLRRERLGQAALPTEEQLRRPEREVEK